MLVEIIADTSVGVRPDDARLILDGLGPDAPVPVPVVLSALPLGAWPVLIVTLASVPLHVRVQGDRVQTKCTIYALRILCALIRLFQVPNVYAMNSSTAVVDFSPSLYIDNAGAEILKDIAESDTDERMQRCKLSSLHISVTEQFPVQQFVEACNDIMSDGAEVPQPALWVNHQNEPFTLYGCHVYIMAKQGRTLRPDGNEFEVQGRRFFVDRSLDASGLGSPSTSPRMRIHAHRRNKRQRE